MPFLANIALRIASIGYEDRLVLLQYPVKPRRRLMPGNLGFEKLNTIMYRGMPTYLEIINGFEKFKKDLQTIQNKAANSYDPFWDNEMLSPLDAVSLYAMVRNIKPKTYLEIGSGNSTKFVSRAIKDGALQTHIISIDPHPRAEIDALCETIIRKPLENAEMDVFTRLEKGDVVYFDGSHHCFMNSDVTVFFLEILPLLKPGVVVHIHDIRLPFDYSTSYTEQHYSEQYLLAMGLLAVESAFSLVLPNSLTCKDADAREIIRKIWVGMPFKDEYIYGCSCWIKTTALSRME